VIGNSVGFRGAGSFYRCDYIGKFQRITDAVLDGTFYLYALGGQGTSKNAEDDD
jgi:hypothetical protein